MKSYEMVETLSDRAKVSLEQAKDALERSNWDILDAAIYLERQKAQMNTHQPPRPAQNSAYYSGDKVNKWSYATQGFDRPGPFDPRTDFNKPNGGFVPPPPAPGAVPPPYKAFPNRPYEGAPNNGDIPPYKNFPNNGGQPHYNGYSYNNSGPASSVSRLIDGIAELIEKVVNALFGTQFIAKRHGKVVFSAPLLITIALGALFMCLTVPALVLGLAFDCKYSVGEKPQQDYYNNGPYNGPKPPEQF